MRHVAVPRAGGVANEVPGIALIRLVGVVGKVSGRRPVVALFVREHVNASGRVVRGNGLGVFHAGDSNALGRAAILGRMDDDDHGRQPSAGMLIGIAMSAVLAYLLYAFLGLGQLFGKWFN
jgi:hypothetical protein